VLHEGPIPRFDAATWRFRTHGLVAQETTWDWTEFNALPHITLTTDFHCVTSWSKLDNAWEGVPFREVFNRAHVAPSATHVIVRAPFGYSANLPLAALLDDDVVFAFTHNGEPLAPKHGGPMRLVVPKRYAWKSVKWANEIEFTDHDEPGFWEVRGYHNDAFPFQEQRYAWQQ